MGKEAQSTSSQLTSGPAKIALEMTTNLSEFRSVVMANILGGSPLFNQLPPEERLRIAEFTSQKSLDKGEYLFRQGDPPRALFLVQSGAINLHCVNEAGKQHVIHVIGAGESFGEGFLASNEPCPLDARAIQRSEVLVIQKPDLLAFLRGHPETFLRLFAALNSYASRLLGQVEDLALTNIETRVGRWLVRHCSDPESIEPAHIRLQTTKRLLAAELGTVSETLSRTLARFRDQQLISVNGKTVTVLNPGRMSRAVGLAPADPELAPTAVVA